MFLAKSMLALRRDLINLSVKENFVFLCSLQSHLEQSFILNSVKKGKLLIRHLSETSAKDEIIFFISNLTY
ncbi:CLUMA_CG012432, isoform A [Clunio marinus]|uniref:CLUMA_CG012432, isoform A n=1 Tax=Clunio marinus TaxID=568069 RepID=A0A1J1IEI6_9DIPT|nr:CLUMA_CG012432, isoform A [Clunio marinus]